MINNNKTKTAPSQVVHIHSMMGIFQKEHLRHHHQHLQQNCFLNLVALVTTILVIQIYIRLRELIWKQETCRFYLIFKGLADRLPGLLFAKRVDVLPQISWSLECSVLDISNRFEIWQAPIRQRHCLDASQMSAIWSFITSNLVASRLHGIWW